MEKEQPDKIQEVRDWSAQEVERLTNEITALPDEERQRRLQDIRESLQSKGVNTDNLTKPADLIVEFVRSEIKEQN